MAYFSRLTDIVTCKLTAILAAVDDPQSALEQIISEMEAGRAGAQRSVAAARRSVQQIEEELQEHREQVEGWRQQAKAALAGGEEGPARLALIRKRELEDVLAGLKQQLEAAHATFEHLSTMQRAIEARLAEARRRLQAARTGRPTAAVSRKTPVADASGSPGERADASEVESLDAERSREIDAELDALRRELGRA